MDTIEAGRLGGKKHNGKKSRDTILSKYGFDYYRTISLRKKAKK
jgi:hypothetical protein